jgi:hypothetical protein
MRKTPPFPQKLRNPKQQHRTQQLAEALGNLESLTVPIDTDDDLDQQSTGRYQGHPFNSSQPKIKKHLSIPARQQQPEEERRTGQR